MFHNEKNPVQLQVRGWFLSVKEKPLWWGKCQVKCLKLKQGSIPTKTQGLLNSKFKGNLEMSRK